jgi:hypothetical protein
MATIGANHTSDSPNSLVTTLSIYARPGIIWFEVLVASALILAMESKTIHRFASYVGPASDSRSIDFVATLLYPLMIAGLAGMTYFSLRRILSAVAEGPTILRIVVFQVLLLLNMALLGMDTMRY